MKLLKRDNIFLFLAIMGITTLMAFVSVQNNNKVNSLDIKITNNQLQYFLTEAELENVVYSIYDSIKNMPVKEINIGMLEDTLQLLTYVENAEVFSTLDGKLSIVVNQNKAIARIYNGNKHYYLNMLGETMPLSHNHSAMVPFVTGQVNEANLLYTHQLLLETFNDPFYENIITGIDYGKSQVTLYTALGKHKIIWGKTEDTHTKLVKLKMFYQSLDTKEELENLKTVNVMYNDQVVYTN